MSAVDSVATDLLCEFHELEQDEVSDARNLGVTEEVLSGMVVKLIINKKEIKWELMVDKSITIDSLVD